MARQGLGDRVLGAALGPGLEGPGTQNEVRATLEYKYVYDTVNNMARCLAAVKSGRLDGAW